MLLFKRALEKTQNPFLLQFPPYYFKPAVYTLTCEWGTYNPNSASHRYSLPHFQTATLIVLPAEEP
jgi:hypothetical protein